MGLLAIRDIFFGEISIHIFHPFLMELFVFLLFVKYLSFEVEL